MPRFQLIGLLLFAQLGFEFQTDEIVDASRPGNGVVNPKVISSPEPKYTEEGKAAHIQGTVMLQIVVDEQGRPTQFNVLSPLGYGLDEAALAARGKSRSPAEGLRHRAANH